MMYQMKLMRQKFNQYFMGKTLQKNKTKNKGVGKVMGRSKGPLVYVEAIGRKTTVKMVNAIKTNKL